MGWDIRQAEKRAPIQGKMLRKGDQVKSILLNKVSSLQSITNNHVQDINNYNEMFLSRYYQQKKANASICLIPID